MQSLSSHSPVRRRRGQGMTEYIIVIAIVAIGAIAIIGLFGKQIKHAFNRMGSSIDGRTVGSAGDQGEAGEAKKQDAMNSFDADASKGAQ
jgi:pilus assembly protein Flp/PilA